MAGQPASRGLLERGAELARIEQAVAALARGDGGVLIVEGAAGIGKSALLRVLCERVDEQRVQRYTARASELESDFGFGVVRQLFERRVVQAAESERTELLAGAASLAGPVLGLNGDVGDSFAVLHGLYWLVANLSTSGPVVLAVDDLQWADEPSLRWLVYLCRRLEGLPVLVAATTHSPGAGHSPLLAELLAVEGVQVLSPSPLSEPAVAQLVRAGLGAAPDPAFVSACAMVSGGNPFVLRELIVDLAAEHVAPTTAQAVAIAERVPARVERVVLARLSRLDQTAIRLSHALAVLGDNSELRLAAVLAELDIETASAAADALVTAELLTASRPLRFVHPLARSAIYEQFALGARAQAHARAARLLIEEDAGSERVAAHLLLCEPAGDLDAVQELRTAAAVALARGAPETATAYLRRALAEPPTGAVRASVLGELGSAERMARDPTAGVHLEEAWQATIEPIARARLAYQLASVLFYSADLARCLAVEQVALNDLGDCDPDLAIRLHADKATLELLNVYPTETSQASISQLRELAGQRVPASRSAQLTLAYLFALRGESCHEIVELVERGWDNGRFLAEETCEAPPAMNGVWALIYIDELDRAHALVEAMLADARARGSAVGFQFATGRRGVIALRQGALAEAEADMLVAFESATDRNLALSVPVHAASLGLTLLERGQLQQASAVVEGVTLAPTIVGMHPSAAIFLEARGRVRLACGDHEQAIADLRHCGELADCARLHNPNFLAWRSTLALELATKDRHEALHLAQTELKLARHVGVSRAIGIALRVCGLLTGGKNGIELLGQSVAMFEHSAMRLELAYSLTELGAALRRSGARATAREPLRRALDLAARCGATALTQRTREEALAAGARPRRPWVSGVQALTPSELRVARLAAQSLSNRDIAQALFITAKTVSDHLTSAYRKLNVHTRDQLATAMAAHT